MGHYPRQWVLVALVLITRSASAEPGEPAPGPSAAATSEPPGSWKPTAGVVTLGGAIVLAGLTYASYAQVKAIDNAPGFQAYVSSYASRGDACAAADAGKRSYAPMAVAASVASDACSRRATWGTVEIVSGIAALTSLGLGIYFLATSPARPPGISLAPRVDPRGAGGVDLTVRF